MYLASLLQAWPLEGALLIITLFIRATVPRLIQRCSSSNSLGDHRDPSTTETRTVRSPRYRTVITSILALCFPPRLLRFQCCLPEYTVKRMQGSLDARITGCKDHWMQGSLEARITGGKDQWRQGSLETRINCDKDTWRQATFSPELKQIGNIQH